MKRPNRTDDSLILAISRNRVRFLAYAKYFFEPKLIEFLGPNDFPKILK
jgi:hypothetical protein